MKTKKQENKALRKLAKEALKASTSEVCQTWKDKILEAVPSLEVKPDLVVGKWYKPKTEEGTVWFIKSINNDGTGNGYGVLMGNWNGNCESICLHEKRFKWSPATEKEVEQALIAEAEKKLGLTIID